MDNKQLVLSYLQMPETLLVGSLSRDFDELWQKEKAIEKEWIGRKKCLCVNNPDILNKRLLLTCEHIKKEIKEKTKEIEKKINLKSDVLVIRNLRAFQNSQNGIHTI